MKYPQYQVGAKWRVEREERPVTFIILGPGSKSGYKKCLVQWDVIDLKSQNYEEEYSVAHLRKHAVYKP
jgi:hypothetical protein